MDAVRDPQRQLIIERHFKLVDHAEHLGANGDDDAAAPSRMWLCHKVTREARVHQGDADVAEPLLRAYAAEASLPAVRVCSAHYQARCGC